MGSRNIRKIAQHYFLHSNSSMNYVFYTIEQITVVELVWLFYSLLATHISCYKQQNHLILVLANHDISPLPKLAHGALIWLIFPKCFQNTWITAQQHYLMMARLACTWPSSHKLLRWIRLQSTSTPLKRWPKPLNPRTWNSLIFALLLGKLKWICSLKGRDNDSARLCCWMLGKLLKNISQ